MVRIVSLNRLRLVSAVSMFVWGSVILQRCLFQVALEKFARMPQFVRPLRRSCSRNCLCSSSAAFNSFSRARANSSSVPSSARRLSSVRSSSVRANRAPVSVVIFSRAAFNSAVVSPNDLRLIFFCGRPVNLKLPPRCLNLLAILRKLLMPGVQMRLIGRERGKRLAELCSHGLLFRMPLPERAMDSFTVDK